MKKAMLGVTLFLFSALAFAGPVNINTADEKMLAKELQGVGPAKAAAIVKYRSEKGPFKSATDLKNVEGVGASILEANKSNIRVKD